MKKNLVSQANIKNMLLQKLLILLIYQKFLCHGSWATRTNAATAASELTSTPAPAPQTTPLVSVSEATLLTNNIFSGFSATQKRPLHFKENNNANNYGHDNEIGTTSLSSLSFSMVSAKEPVPFAPNTVASNSLATTATKLSMSNNGNGYKILSTRTNCTRDLFEMNIQLDRNFRGLLYAKDFPLECRSRGTSHFNITLRLPTSGCGVRVEPCPDGTMELSVRVMLQMEKKLHQSTDILRIMRCKLPMNAMGMTLVAGGRLKTPRNGRMRAISVSDENNATTQTVTSKQQLSDVKTNTQRTPIISPSTNKSTMYTPRVRIWLELGGPGGSGAVEVGQATTLTVRAIVPGTIGVRVIDCAALDGLGDSTQQLLDERGCPIDEQVMPALHKRFQPAEEGWSKQSEDDLVEKMFTATFPAFKFPDRERLHVSCGVQLCKGKCPNVDCLTDDMFLLTTDKHLARIEVFNSLAVTAPQIEVDRLRYDQRYNMSVEDYSPYFHPLPSEGTLCLSVSKLALSFCVLGLIFLIAIIVAICSVIRSRRCAVSGITRVNLNRQEVCTSMFSSSSESAQSTKFGSKLFIPYYPNTLPYGRVD